MVGFLAILFFVSIIGIIMGIEKKKYIQTKEKQNDNINNKKLLIISIFLCVVSIIGIGILKINTEIPNIKDEITENEDIEDISYDLSNIPQYATSPFVKINGGIPFFEDSDLKENSYEEYSELDKLGRCQAAIACIGIDLMPTTPRKYIGNIKPTGWDSVQYDGIDGGYLYNRCHLIGYQLTGENANELNLITGTIYMNVDGMLPFENMVADYIKETNNHVLYRVTPIFEGDNQLASGVLMEAKSVEDNGKGIMFNVYCYNVQPGIEIEYATGARTGPKYNGGENTESDQENDYILNNSSMKFHKITCGSVETINEKNKEEYRGFRSELIINGYKPCKSCNP